MNSLTLILLNVFIYFIPLCYLLPFKMRIQEKTGLFLILLINISLMIYVTGNIGVIFLLVTIGLYISFIRPKRLLNLCALITIYMFCVICDNAYSILCTFLGFPIYSMEKDTFPFFLSMFVFTLLLCLICLLLSRLLQHLRKRINLDYSIRLFLPIMLNLVFCLFIFLFNIIAGEEVGYTTEIVTFNCILFGCYFIISAIVTIFSFKSYVSQQEMKTRQDAFDALQRYTEQVESTYDSLRSFKHDYFNIMLSMSHYIESGDTDGLKIFFSEKIAPINRQISKDTAHLNQLKKLGIPELKSLVSSKLLYAADMGINVSIEISAEITSLSLEVIDFVRVIGILLDNAIEAALECDAPAIWFSAVSLEKQYVFIIKNTFVDKGVSLTAIRQPNISTKGKSRGVGLYNVAQIFQKYKDVFWETETDENIFIQKVELPHI